MALAEKLLAEKYGKDLVDHHTYVIVGDGCLAEGISQEALNIAVHLGLDKLMVLFDDNQISIDGATSLFTSEDQEKRFAAAGFDVFSADGHNFESVDEAINKAKQSSKPAFIACRTKIGFGSPNKAGTAGCHGAPLGEEEIKLARKELGCDWPAFTVPENILSAWRQAGSKGAEDKQAWQKRLEGAKQKQDFLNQVSQKLPDDLPQLVERLKQAFSEDGSAMATRKASGKVLDELVSSCDLLLGGSADLSGSNNTKAATSRAISKDDLTGNYIHYGPREHAMAAVMNGLALHGGYIPYGGTFLIFSDYCKNAMRLSALMKQRVIYVMTHDSIGLGEDGPTHQPIEQLVGLRTVPNLMVYRPCDAIEVAECWELALMSKNAPSVIVLSRQSLPIARSKHASQNLATLGGYVIAESETKRQVSLIASGSEVAIALQAKQELDKRGMPTAVISLPCWALFNMQSAEYKRFVLGGDNVFKLAVEASYPLGWRNFVGSEGDVIGLTDFGLSAPAGDLYRHFGLTSQHIVQKVEDYFTSRENE